jgi:hypothetical protein
MSLLETVNIRASSKLTICRLLSGPATYLDGLAAIIIGLVRRRQHLCSFVDVCYSVRRDTDIADVSPSLPLNSHDPKKFAPGQTFSFESALSASCVSWSAFPLPEN